jgi:hypothetical protein
MYGSYCHVCNIIFLCIKYINPLNSLRPKTGRLLFGQLVWRFLFFSSIFSFRWVNYIFHKLSVNTKHVQFRLRMSPWQILLKTSIKLIFFCIFWGAPTWSHVAKTAQGLKGRVLKKQFFLPIETWIFTFFHFFFAHGSAWHHLQCDSYNLNVKFLIFFKIFYKVHNVEVWSQDPINKNNSSSVILTNLELRFEPCMLNLIWKWGAKDPQKREDQLIFIRLMFNKVISRSYGYFLKSSYFFW